MFVRVQNNLCSRTANILLSLLDWVMFYSSDVRLCMCVWLFVSVFMSLCVYVCRIYIRTIVRNYAGNLDLFFFGRFLHFCEIYNKAKQLDMGVLQNSCYENTETNSIKTFMELPFCNLHTYCFKRTLFWLLCCKLFQNTHFTEHF